MKQLKLQPKGWKRLLSAMLVFMFLITGIALPIVMDYEFRNDPVTNAPGRLRAAGLSKENGTAVVNAFCDRVRSTGYTPMVYANKTMLNNYLNPKAITDAGNRVWLAHYTTASDYAGLYDFWQFTSKASGTAYGASSTYLDLDYCMITEPSTEKIIPLYSTRCSIPHAILM